MNEEKKKKKKKCVCCGLYPFRFGLSFAFVSFRDFILLILGRSPEHESLLHPEPQQMGHHCIGWCPVLGGKQRVSASVIDCGW